MTGSVKQTFTPLDEASIPAPLATVWCRFPFAQRPGRPGKPRPALVFSVRKHAIGFYVVEVAYGTSKLKSETRPLDFQVSNYAAMHWAGLSQATRFDLDNIKFLPWASEWFFSPDLKKYDTPVIGSLPVDHVPYLKEILIERAAKGMKVPDCP